MIKSMQLTPVPFGTDPLGAGQEQADKEPTKAPQLPEDNALGIVIREQTVDNPGRGNCAFYAFAIGLIYIIQEEQSYGSKSMFERWVALDGSINTLYDDLCNFDFQHPNKALLEQLQKILRLTTYKFQFEELRQACVDSNADNGYKHLIATSSFTKFAQMYYGTMIERNFNEFAKSGAIKGVIKKIDRKTVVSGSEHLVLAPLFMSLIYGEGVIPLENTVPKNDSPVLKAMQNITADFFWGTHLDLDYLARAFRVNLHTLKNGRPLQVFKDVLANHTITVNNHFNVHWTTKVTMAHEAKLMDKIDTSRSLASEEYLMPFDLPSDDTVIKNRFNRAKASVFSKRGTSAKTFAKAAGKRDFFKDVHEVPVVPMPQMKNEAEVKLGVLRHRIGLAVSDYVYHSEKIWFSLFHRHTGPGRLRAQRFLKEISLINDYDAAKKFLFEFLKNNKNGNTHPHSFRTMLVHELLNSKSRKVNLDSVSRTYLIQIKELESRYGLQGAKVTFNQPK